MFLDDAKRLNDDFGYFIKKAKQFRWTVAFIPFSAFAILIGESFNFIEIHLFPAFLLTMFYFIFIILLIIRFLMLFLAGDLLQKKPNPKQP